MNTTAYSWTPGAHGPIYTPETKYESLPMTPEQVEESGKALLLLLDYTTYPIRVAFTWLFC